MAADTCANCGAVGGGDDDGAVKLKKCNGCLLVKYCGSNCQKAHRSAHKRACKKEAERLREEKLFDMPSVEWEECPVCLLRMPFDREKFCYMPCCGKEICHGCADKEMGMRVKEGFNRPDGKVDFSHALDSPCPFCRSHFSIKIEDYLDELGKRADKGDPRAMYHLAIKIAGPEPMGPIPADPKRARELLLRSAKSGYSLANLSVGMFLYDGKYPAVFEKDVKKARKYFVVGALGGDPIARAYLGEIELDRFNVRAAYRHQMIAASHGYQLALDNVLNGYKKGCVSKDEYETTLRAYQAASDEMKSPQRSEAEKSRAELDTPDVYPSSFFEALNQLERMRNMGGDGPVHLFGSESAAAKGNAPQRKK